jgi:hypothetical protein
MTENYDPWKRRYDDAFARLVARVQAMNESGYSPTPLRNSMQKIAEQLEETANLLGEQGSAQFEIETFHDNIQDENGDSQHGSYQSIKWQIRDLARSARSAMGTLPNPREKHALPFAAEALLYLREDCGYGPPALSNSDPAVEELHRLCRLASGSWYSPERLRGAISDALKNHKSKD